MPETDQSAVSQIPGDEAVTEVDAAVVGMGFGGVYLLHKLRNELDLDAVGFDRAEGVGGTWFWNRYPGAQSDVASHMYRFSFDEELLQEGALGSIYWTQPEIVAYLDHVVDRFGLREHLRLGDGVASATWDDASHSWLLRTDSGKRWRARHLVTALGVLSAPLVPDIAGLETFEGEVFHTSRWPETWDFTGKRVGVVGTGSSGQQVVPAIAPQAEQVTVFQRTPQFSLPSHNRALTEAEVADIKTSYPALWDYARSSYIAAGFEESQIESASVSDEERDRIFEEAWQDGGPFRFLFGTFADLAVDQAANDHAAAFLRAKIASTVTDPDTARRLTPSAGFTRRPTCNTGYYEAFNRDDVSLVDLREAPLVEASPHGLRTADGVEHPLDVLVLATGFEAVDGYYRRMEIVGRDGLRLDEAWSPHAHAYQGVQTAGFPNMFMVLGPQCPFANVPTCVEVMGDFITDLLSAAREQGADVVEASADAEQAWSQECEEIAFATLFAQEERSWVFGTNVPGRPGSALFYLGGLGVYRQRLAETAEAGYAGYRIGQEAPVAAQP